MMRTKVAVFPCGSEVGLEINRALRYSRHFHLVGLNSTADHGRTVYKEYCDTLPSYGEPGFIPELKTVIKDQNIRFLIPTMDKVAAFLKEYEEELGCEVICADSKVMQILISKSKTYKYLKQYLKVPKLYSDYSEIKANLPVFTKPDIGYGSRNAVLVETEDQLRKRWQEREGLLFCEYLPGKEYTVDCFSDESHVVLYVGARERRRVRMGISVNTIPVDLGGIEHLADKISRVLSLKGVWFFQVKENEQGALVLLEVASRVSGSMALNRMRGINFILLELFQRLGYPVSVLSNGLNEIELERSFDCKVIAPNLVYQVVYVDFDDCLVINDKLNTQLLRFLYQQVNERKRVILITKHEGDLTERLKEYRLDKLFDKVIHLRKDESKYLHMNCKRSILIDDSHKERQEVIRQLGIPALSPDVIGSLIDYKKL